MEIIDRRASKALGFLHLRGETFLRLEGLAWAKLRFEKGASVESVVLLDGLDAGATVLEVNVLISRTVYVVVLAQRMQDGRQLDPVRLPSSVSGRLRKLVTSALIEVSLPHVHLTANAVIHLARLLLMLHLLDYRRPCVSLLPLIKCG